MIKIYTLNKDIPNPSGGFPSLTKGMAYIRLGFLASKFSSPQNDLLQFVYSKHKDLFTLSDISIKDTEFYKEIESKAEILMKDEIEKVQNSRKTIEEIKKLLGES